MALTKKNIEAKKVRRRAPDSVRLPVELKIELRKAAIKDKRTLSNLMIKILLEWVEKSNGNGHLKK